MLQLGLMIAVVAVAVGLGYRTTAAWWGEPGLRSMWAAAAICLIAGVLAFVPLAVTVLKAPSYAGQAAFAGTTIRLLATAGLTAAWQMLNDDVHLRSLLNWLVVLYLPLLAVETGIGVVLVRRSFAAAAPRLTPRD